MSYKDKPWAEWTEEDAAEAQRDFEAKICKSCGAYGTKPHACPDTKDGLRTFGTIADLSTGKPETLEAADFDREQIVKGERRYAQRTGQVTPDEMPFPESEELP